MEADDETLAAMVLPGEEEPQQVATRSADGFPDWLPENIWETAELFFGTQKKRLMIHLALLCSLWSSGSSTIRRWKPSGCSCCKKTGQRVDFGWQATS